MSYAVVRSKTVTAFNEIQVFLNFIASQEPRNPQDPTPLEVKVMRGLFYVHLYAAIELSVSEMTQQTILLINSKSVKNNHYITKFNTISVIDKIKSLKDSSYKNLIPKSAELFEEISSRNVRSLNETMFANSLQNIWIKTVEELVNAFGMKPIIFQARERATIDEIVDKRNSVAHGREKASFVGERHRSIILRTKLNISQAFVQKLIYEFEDYYMQKKFLKPIMKKHYP